MQKDIDTWNYEYDLVRKLYEKIETSEHSSLDNNSLRNLFLKGIITYEEYDFYVNEFNIEQWITSQKKEFHGKRLSKYRIMKLQQINVLSNEKRFTKEDQEIYDKLCLAIIEAKQNPLDQKEKLEIMEEIRNNINTSANLEKILATKLNLIKRYIDLNYYHQEEQNYNLEDYIFACIEGIIKAIKDPKQRKNPVIFIQRQIDQAVQATCSTYFDESIKNIAIDERYAFSELINQDVNKNIEDLLNEILYNNLEKAGIRNIYMDLIDMLELGKYNIYEIINYLSEKYNIANDIEIYQNIITRITNIIYKYLNEIYQQNNCNKEELIKDIKEIIFFNPKRSLQKFEEKSKIKNLLEEDMREYFPYLKLLQYNKITKRYMNLEQVIPKTVKLSDLEHKIMYKYISLSKENRKKLRLLILQIKNKESIPKIEDIKLKEIIYIIKENPTTILTLERLFIEYDAPTNKISLSNCNKLKSEVLDKKEELSQFIRDKGINITDETIIKESMEYKEVYKEVLKLIIIEKENIFNLLREYAKKYSNENLIEALKIYYYTKDLEERSKKLMEIGVDNPKNTKYKAITLIRKNLSNTDYPIVIGDYMFLSNDKKYYKYKK